MKLKRCKNYHKLNSVERDTPNEITSKKNVVLHLSSSSTFKEQKMSHCPLSTKRTFDDIEAFTENVLLGCFATKTTEGAN